MNHKPTSESHSGRGAGAKAALGVVVTCHAPYLKFASACVASVDVQHNGPVVFCFDGEAADSPVAFPGWAFVSEFWRNPNKARNAGRLCLAGQAAAPEWVIFVDADDCLPKGYIDAMKRAIAAVDDRVGIVYPAIDRVDYASGAREEVPAPAWDYWRQRERPYIQSASAWRVKALEEVGGWDEESVMHDDTNLAMRVTAAGWEAAPLDGPTLFLRLHDEAEHRCLSRSWETRVAAEWRFKSIGVVIPASGREKRWPGWLANLELPRFNALYLVDNSASGAWPGLDVERFGRVVRRRFQAPSQSGRDRKSLVRHRHVADIYNSILSEVREDFVLTVEDDVWYPPHALKSLFALSGMNKFGAAAAVYESASCPGGACGSLNPDRWEIRPLDSFPGEPTPAAFVPGGFTLWSNAALRRCLPVRATGDEGADRVEFGWDANLSLALRERGHSLTLHGGLRAVHFF